MKIKAFLLILFSVLSFSVSSGQKNNKKIVLTGTVINAGQKPIVGALILIDGNNTNVVTDNNGLFKLKVRPDADSLTIVTFTNGVSTVAIDGRTNINFILGNPDLSKQDVQKKSENSQQVNIGYGKVSEKNLLTNVNTIDARSSKYASYKNIYEILKGTPGVIVRGNSVQIQGQSSFNSGTEPLYIVDGMAVESIDGISPSMVESISVLKGASASIYGSRGANGAIIITLITSTIKEK
jgi:TonB-dependent SusC/RagA subfamily outer membrane receptor